MAGSREGIRGAGEGTVRILHPLTLMSLEEAFNVVILNIVSLMLFFHVIKKP